MATWAYFSAFFAKFNVVDSIKNVSSVLSKGGINASKLPIVNALNYITEIYEHSGSDFGAVYSEDNN